MSVQLNTIHQTDYQVERKAPRSPHKLSLPKAPPSPKKPLPNSLLTKIISPIKQSSPEVLPSQLRPIRQIDCEVTRKLPPSPHKHSLPKAPSPKKDAPNSLATKNISPIKQSSPEALASWRVRIENGKIVTSPPSNVRRKLQYEDLEGDVIYRIHHEEKKRDYIGSVKLTEKQTVAKRFGVYDYRINSDSIGKRMYVENAVKKSPTKMRISIIDRVRGATEEILHKREEEWQNRYHTRDRKYGYNQSQPTKEPNRAGPRKPRDPTKIRAVPMKKQVLPARDQSQRKAAAVAREILKKLS